MKKPRVVVANVSDYDIVVKGFELQSRSFVLFRTNTLGSSRNSLSPPAVGKILRLLFLRGIKYPMNIDMSLTEEAEPKDSRNTCLLSSSVTWISFVYSPESKARKTPPGYTLGECKLWIEIYQYVRGHILPCVKTFDNSIEGPSEK